MNRRAFLRSTHCDAAADSLLQSNMVVTIETDANITGIGEGGTRDTIEPCAGRLIGKNPFQIERLWQDMYRGLPLSPGRGRLHAIGALDLALWISKARRLASRSMSSSAGLTATQRRSSRRRRLPAARAHLHLLRPTGAGHTVIATVMLEAAGPTRPSTSGRSLCVSSSRERTQVAASPSSSSRSRR